MTTSSPISNKNVEALSSIRQPDSSKETALVIEMEPNREENVIELRVGTDSTSILSVKLTYKTAQEMAFALLMMSDPT